MAGRFPPVGSWCSQRPVQKRRHQLREPPGPPHSPTVECVGCHGAWPRRLLRSPWFPARRLPQAAPGCHGSAGDATRVASRFHCQGPSGGRDSTPVGVDLWGLPGLGSLRSAQWTPPVPRVVPTCTPIGTGSDSRDPGISPILGGVYNLHFLND